MATKKNYTKKIVTPPVKGFGKMSEKHEKELRGQAIFLALGYQKYFDWTDVEPDTLSFVQKFWVEGNAVFDALNNNDYWTARHLLEEGPWTYKDLGVLIRELDEWALGLSEERREIGAMPMEEIEYLTYAGLHYYHEALVERHPESIKATESLQKLLEQELGAEMVDTGATYDREGNQQGGRDLVMELKNGEEVALHIHHNPRRAEYEGAIPERMKALIAQWEAAA